MRWCVSSDWQFGEYGRLSRGITKDGITTRLQEFLDAWDWMLSVASAHDALSLAVLGDVLDDRAAVPSTVLDAVGSCLMKTGASGFETHLLVGNHDSALKSPKLTSLRAFTGLATVHNSPVVTSDGLGFVPWTADLTQLSEWCAQVADEGADYLLSHVMVQGSVPADVGVDPKLLHPARFRNVLLGDVHAPIPIGKNIQYIGSPLQINFGDAGSDRGVWILDTEADTLDFIVNGRSPRFWNVYKPKDAAKVGKHDYVKIRVDNEDDAERVDVALKNQPQWVQSEFVASLDDPPRLQVSTSETLEDTLRRYCKLMERDGLDEAVKVGMEIMEEARRGL